MFILVALFAFYGFAQYGLPGLFSPLIFAIWGLPFLAGLVTLWAGARQSKYPQLLLRADETGIKLRDGETTHWGDVEAIIVLNSYLGYSPKHILTVRRRYKTSGSAAKRAESVARHVLEDRSTPISLSDRPVEEIVDRLGSVMAGAGFRLDDTPMRKFRGLWSQNLWRVISHDHKDLI